jgi:RNA polymerase sigma factor (sigma-70 family)
MTMQSSPPTDADLLSRYMQAGDEAAFTALVRAHERLVIGTAARITGNAELARDVAQQVFATLAQKGWMLTDRTSLAGWLHHAARHVALRVARSETARNRRHEQLTLDNPAAPESDVWPMLEEALATLPDAEREAVVMHHLQDRSYAEMATALGLTEAAARKRVSRGIQNLGTQLRKRGFGGSAASLLAGATALQMGTPSVAVAATLTSAAPFSLTLTTLIAMTTTTKLLLTAAAVISVCFVAFRPNGGQTESSTAATRMQPANQAKPATKGSSDTEKRRYRPAPVTREVTQTVEAIIRRHQGMTKPELQKSAELNKLMDRFIAVMGAPEIQAKLEQRVAALPAEHGTVKMDFDLLDDAHGRAWLEAAVSDDPQRIEDWLLNTLDGAIFEFAFDPNLERTSNGVSLQPATLPQKDPPAQPNQND